MKKIKYIKGKENYSFQDDILSIIPLKRNYDSSFQIGNFIFDLDKNKKIVGVEILNTSELFNISKLFLKNIHSGKLDIEVNDSFIKLKISIKTHIRNADRVSSLNIERVKPDFLEPTQLNLAVL